MTRFNVEFAEAVKPLFEAFTDENLTNSGTSEVGQS